LALPQRIVAIELSREPAPLLMDYIEAYDMADTVRPYFGVNQADRARLAEIAADEFADAPLDLVIDDASHRYAESRASFETLFPLLRTGGVYIIEDWRWQHRFATAFAAAIEQNTAPAASRDALAQRLADISEGRVAADVPLSRLVFELMLARAAFDDVITEVRVSPFWAVITRGSTPLSTPFDVGDVARDDYGILKVPD
jgi:hypothetical protein